ncbi:hypothetical protein [Deinococcus ruber]|uniref:Uncharacterized protein n=1 Tax=Deinococcus ruber TaxID=1848197 RepID=A0A918CJF2_9DEIO|nr:hypothetical protein [Deinococcus ruber]GGR26041.1 hypothetical protein GCM10008957_42120 [Deinococcus ruber]
MHPLLITLVVVLVALFLLWPLVNGMRRRSASQSAPRRSSSPAQPSAPSPAPSGVKLIGTAPPGTANLDDVDAVRPDIDASALATARSGVTQVVPDGVLADALLDVTPDQLKSLFASVSADVIAAAVGNGSTGKDNVQQKPLKAEDLALLNGAGEAVDDLDIWSFAEKK